MILMREMTPATSAAGRGSPRQDAVDAEADEQLAADGLEVDVGRALVDRLGDERVDELDDRGLVGGLAQVDDLGAFPRSLVGLLDDRRRRAGRGAR